MSEREIVNAIKKYIGKQNGDWTFVRGRDVLTRQQTLVRLKTDPKFKKFMVRIVVAQTIEILGREVETPLEP